MQSLYKENTKNRDLVVEFITTKPYQNHTHVFSKSPDQYDLYREKINPFNETIGYIDPIVDSMELLDDGDETEYSCREKMDKPKSMCKVKKREVF